MCGAKDSYKSLTLSVTIPGRKLILKICQVGRFVKKDMNILTSKTRQFSQTISIFLDNVSVLLNLFQVKSFWQQIMRRNGKNEHSCT